MISEVSQIATVISAAVRPAAQVVSADVKSTIHVASAAVRPAANYAELGIIATIISVAAQFGAMYSEAVSNFINELVTMALLDEQGFLFLCEDGTYLISE